VIKYPLSDDTWGQEEIDAINEVVASRRFTMGAKTKEFEEKFANYFGSKYAVMVNSGSSANLIAIAALIFSGRLNRGDEIIVPAVSWSTTYYPLYQYGLKLIFVDIDLNTLNIDKQQIESAITPKTKAIFTVNLLGNPNEYDEIINICDKHGLILIEDNCEAMGAKYNNKFTGTFGIIGTFSTFYSHHICTMEGGIAITDDEELYHYMLSLRAHGWTRDIPHSSKIYQKSPSEFYESYNFILPGYNVRPLEIEAAVGIEQLKKLERFVSIRRQNAEYFRELCHNLNNIVIQEEIGQSSWFGFSIVLINDLRGQRDNLINELKKNDIEVRPIVAGNITFNKSVKYLDYRINNRLKNADYIHVNGYFIGNHSKDLKKEIDQFYDLFSSFMD